MSYYHRAAPAVIDKVDGNENQNFEHHPAKVYKDATDFDHWGKPEATIQYDGNEFFCRVSGVDRKEWCFRALSIDALRSQIERKFPDSRGRLSFRLNSAAHLAEHGEKYALLKV